jgi:uncharacterized surface protein with fasciclin (FAS1) repeats
MKRTIGMLTAVTLLAAAFTAGPVQTARADSTSTTQPSIVEAAIAVNQQTGEFSTLIAAVVAAGLVDTLNANRQFTVFAPTDAAFAKLGLDATSVAALPKEALTNILLYHVAPGERLAADVLAASKIRMLNKGFTTVDPTGGINDARILATDIDVRNGVIHVIDTVLLP